MDNAAVPRVASLHPSIGRRTQHFSERTRDDDDDDDDDDGGGGGGGDDDPSSPPMLRISYRKREIYRLCITMDIERLRFMLPPSHAANV